MTDHSFDTSRLGRIADWQNSYVEARKYPGSSVLVRQGDKEVYFNAAGSRNVEDGLPYERDTLVRVYSMTKPITSAALMILVEKGMFQLGTPVSEFIPEFSDMHALVEGATRIDQTEPCATPTLHHLLTHTSGLSYPFNPGVLPEAMAEDDLVFGPTQGVLAETTAKLAALPLAFHPGARWEYSVGIDVIGRVIEVASGKSLDQFFQEEIFAPLGMTETSFSVPSGAGDRFASLYTPLEGNAMALNSAATGGDTLRLVENYKETKWAKATQFSGGGGLVSSIDDYANFADMLRKGGARGSERILSPHSLDFMMRNHLAGDIASMGPSSFAEQPMDGMGFGIGGAVVLDPALARVPGHIGDFSWGGMASTFFWIDRASDLSVVFFTQLSPSSSYPARSELKALIHGALIA